MLVSYLPPLSWEFDLLKNNIQCLCKTHKKYKSVASWTGNYFILLEHFRVLLFIYVSIFIVCWYFLNKERSNTGRGVSCHTGKSARLRHSNKWVRISSITFIFRLHSYGLNGTTTILLGCQSYPYKKVDMPLNKETTKMQETYLCAFRWNFNYVCIYVCNRDPAKIAHYSVYV